MKNPPKSPCTKLKTNNKIPKSPNHTSRKNFQWITITTLRKNSRVFYFLLYMCKILCLYSIINNSFIIEVCRKAILVLFWFSDDCFSHLLRLLCCFLLRCLLLSLHIWDITAFFCHYSLGFWFIFFLYSTLIYLLLLLIRIYETNDLFMFHLVQSKLFLFLLQYKLLPLHFHFKLSPLFFKISHFLISFSLNHWFLSL